MNSLINTVPQVATYSASGSPGGAGPVQFVYGVKSTDGFEPVCLVAQWVVGTLTVRRGGMRELTDGSEITTVSRSGSFAGSPRHNALCSCAKGQRHGAFPAPPNSSERKFREIEGVSAEPVNAHQGPIVINPDLCVQHWPRMKPLRCSRLKLLAEGDNSRAGAHGGGGSITPLQSSGWSSPALSESTLKRTFTRLKSSALKIEQSE